MRTLIALGAAGFIFAVGACSGPNSGTPERLVLPKEKAPPPAPDAGPVAAGTPAPGPGDTCRTNFFADPVPLEKRDPKKATQMTQQANRVLLDAEILQGEPRKIKVLDAMATLRNALKADPYGAEATYQLAVAYAMADRKACALALLERIAALKAIPGTEKDVDRVVQRALRDPAFEPFRADANGKLGAK
jgi:hypothetical protein